MQWTRCFPVVIIAVILASIVSLNDGKASEMRAQDDCTGEYTAQIFLGRMDGWVQYFLGINYARMSQTNFEQAGYVAIADTDATVPEVVAALNDECTRALWIMGHAGYDPPKKDRNFRVGIGMTDGRDITDLLVPINPNLHEVVLHACGQDQQRWRNRFPGANFTSWTGSVWVIEIELWENVRNYPDIDQQTGELVLAANDQQGAAVRTRGISPPMTRSPEPMVSAGLDSQPQVIAPAQSGDTLCDECPGSPDCGAVVGGITELIDSPEPRAEGRTSTGDAVTPLAAVAALIGGSALLVAGGVYMRRRFRQN